MKDTKPEILAPVGDWEMCVAAVHSGADAIYVGMPGFNARGRAVTFSIEDLRKIIEYCHFYGVRVFVAFNVLIFEHELEPVLELLEVVIGLAPDAFIVQDIGASRLIRALAPDQEIHASTQMTVTSAEAIEAIDGLGFSRYILGREVSIDEMRAIREKTTKELEVFVHGALCVSYSGQCLTSERIGGRSANRGQCAQSCRLDYDLIVDGERRELQDKRYLVSPKDLCALEDVPRLVEAGINSFKIEGRLKSPEYVASTVRGYRLKRDGESTCDTSLVQDMATIYSRDFFNGWMDGVNHQRLVRADFSSNQGLEIGRVTGRTAFGFTITASRPPLRGEGILLLTSDGEKVGGPVYHVRFRGNGEWEISFAKTFPLDRIRDDSPVFLNSSPSLSKELRSVFTDRSRMRRVPVEARVSGAAGTPLTLTLTDDECMPASASTALLLEPARGAPISKDVLMKEITKIGGAGFSVTKLTCELEGSLFIPQSEIKDARQAAAAALTESRSKRRAALTDRASAMRLLSRPVPSPRPQSSQPSLNVLIREQSQIEALADLPIGTVYLDYEFGKEYAGSVERLRSMGLRAGIATTRIHKPGENGHLKQIIRLRPDSVLVRNLGALRFLQGKGIQLAGDFSLNASNSITAAWLLEQGLERLTPSYDLNHEQLSLLLDRIPAGSTEVTVHQYMPSFHMEHCVFAAFLSNGTSYRDCGRPCEAHRVELRDRKGKAHPLKADAECRNTMFNGEPQSAARLIPELIARGVRTFRLEALYETPAELRAKVECYLDVVSGRKSAAEAFASLAISERYGVSEGQLFNIGTYSDRKKAANV